MVFPLACVKHQRIEAIRAARRVRGQRNLVANIVIAIAQEFHAGNFPIIRSSLYRRLCFHQHVPAPIEIQVELDCIRPGEDLVAIVSIEQGKARVEPGAVAAQFSRQDVQIGEEKILGLGVEGAFVTVDLPTIATGRRLDQLTFGGKQVSGVAIRDQLLIDRAAGPGGVLKFVVSWGGAGRRASRKREPHEENNKGAKLKSSAQFHSFGEKERRKSITAV